MAETSQAETKKVRLAAIPPSVGPTFKRWLLDSLRTIARACGVQIQIDGAQSASDGSTINFKIPGGGAAAEGHPWKPTAIDATHISLLPGYVSDFIHSFYPDVSSITVNETALNYVSAKCAITPVFNDGYCNTGAITAVTVEASTTAPVSDNDFAYIPLLLWEAGVAQQLSYFSIAGKFESGGEDVALFQHWPAS